jgi:hypothetical protein
MSLINRQVSKSPDRNTLEAREPTPLKRPSSGCLDRVFLIGAAFLVCVLLVAAFWIADAYHINAMWVFLLWNSLFIVHLSFKDFRTHLRKPAFVGFLIAWGVVHGVVVVAMMRRIPVVLWIFVISFELLVGYLLADRIFGIRRAPKETTE